MLLGFMLLVACHVEKPDTGTARLPPWQTDEDGDEAYADVDCDDADPDRYPGAPERCDGVDQDCDGTVDNYAIDAPYWYADDDGDGYPSDHGTASCTAIPNTYTSGTDCADSDPTRFPGAEERCDGVDDDCDGEVDEGELLDAPAWYTDRDGDTFGDPDSAVIVCTAPRGTVADGTDCDDGAPEVHPGAAEACNDRDDDCDGEIDETPSDGAPYFPDGDGDGAGDGVSVSACEAPPGYAAVDGDCDDADPSVYPDADELCDEVDQDCDGLLDNNAIDRTTWHADADGDGAGDPATTALYCSPPLGWVASADDCDDTDPARSPGEPEVCDDVDQDCDGAIDEDAIDALSWYGDADGDGYGDLAVLTLACTVPAGSVADPTDCDDADASISPAATETCDGADDDCDGTVDEDDAVDALTWYADADADGYGDPGAPAVACEAPLGYLADAADCDDTDATTSPAAAETCDGADDDCDGTIDEDDAVDALTWYADADADAYGDPDAPTAACAAPAGYVADATDCDDTTEYAAPNRPETCGDGLDNNCNGDDDGCTLEGELELDVVFHARIVGNAAGAEVGQVVALGGDLDGVGDEDLLVGAYGLAEVWMVPGVPYGDIDGGDVTTGGYGTVRTSPTIGRVAVALGDFDGDGYDDAAVADEYTDGEVWVLRGPWEEFYTDTDAALLVEAPIPYDQQLALAAGDVDGDGLGDLVIGVPDDEAAFVFYGGGTGTLSIWAADRSILWDTGNFGSAVAGVGDLDGDGLDDILVGAPADSTAGLLAGAAYLWLGAAAAETTSADPTTTFLGESAYDQAGTSVARAGDIDADGTDELLVGAPFADGGGASSGAAYLLRGPFSGTSTLSDAAAVLYGEAAGDRAGAAVSTAGDLDDDGYGDIAVGAWGNDDGGASAGATYVLFGPDPWDTALGAAQLELVGPASAQAGWSVTGGEDLTGDGRDDLLVGGPGAADNGVRSGAAWLIAGSGP